MPNVCWKQVIKSRPQWFNHDPLGTHQNIPNPSLTRDQDSWGSSKRPPVLRMCQLGAPTNPPLNQLGHGKSMFSGKEFAGKTNSNARNLSEPECTTWYNWQSISQIGVIKAPAVKAGSWLIRIASELPWHSDAEVDVWMLKMPMVQSQIGCPKMKWCSLCKH